MTLVPPGARSSKARAAILGIQQVNQNAKHVGQGNMNFADSVTLSKVEGYVPLSFTESDVQIKTYILVLCSLMGLRHPLTIGYRQARDYLENNKIELQEALINSVGARQAPVMQSYLFQKLVQGFFQEQSTYNYAIEPLDLIGNLR